MKYSVFASVGSNIQPRENIIEGLIRILQDPEIELTRISPVYRTQPVKMNDAAELFHNLCLELSTNLAPPELKERFLEIEDSLGRQRDPASITSRVLDLDILIYCPPREDFSVHHQVHEEAFVIVPLADLLDPGSCEELPDSRAEWLERCDRGIVTGVVNYDWPNLLKPLARPAR